MDAILLFSHGSVLCGAERDLVALAKSMERNGAAAIVEPAFLNYSRPLFSDAVDRAVARGASAITVAPYFLVAGTFVVDAMPQVITEARERHRDIEFRVAEAILYHPMLADVVLECAARATSIAQRRAEIAAAREWCRRDRRCPLFGSETCRESESA